MTQCMHVFISVTQNEYELYQLLKQEAAGCTNLGVHLHIPLDTLKHLERHHATKKPIKDCFRDMCQFWLKNAEDKRWKVLYKALDDCGNRALMAKLERTGYLPSAPGICLLARTDRTKVCHNIYSTVDLALEDLMNALDDMRPSGTL